MMKTKTTPVKHYILSLAFLSGSLVTQAQIPGLKERKITLKNESKLVYHMDKDNHKEGPYYIKKAKSDQLVVKGAYSDNKRSGNWYFYDETGKLESIYSFQQNKLAFIDSTLLNKITINIPGKGKDVIENTKIPVLLSSVNLFLAAISNSILIPADHFIVNQLLPIQVISKIDEEGDSKYFVSYKHNGKTLEQQVKLKDNDFEIQWIPAMYNKEPVKSEYILNTVINSSADNSEGHKRFRWNE